MREALYTSDAVAGEVEHLQFTLGEGPCIDATNSGTPVFVDDLDSKTDQLNERWPIFVREATRAGVRAIFAFPVRVGAPPWAPLICTAGRRGHSVDRS